MLLFDLYVAEFERRANECAIIVAKLNKTGQEEQEFANKLNQLKNMLQIIKNVRVSPSTRYKGMSIDIPICKDVKGYYKRTEQLERAFNISKNLQHSDPHSVTGSSSIARAASLNYTSENGYKNDLLRTNAEMDADLGRLEGILKASVNTETVGVSTLMNLHGQREMLNRTEGGLQSTSAGMKDANAVLTRVSTWFNQFK